MNYESEQLVDNVLDSLETAKKATAMLPPLPPSIKPVHMRLLNAIYRIRDRDGYARITDINKFLQFLLPNTTKFINELHGLGIIEKTAQPTDKRVVLVHTTNFGEQLIKKYIVAYHFKLRAEFEKLGASECGAMVEAIKKVYEIIKDVYQN